MKTFILYSQDSPMVTFRVQTDDSYIVRVDDLTGSSESFEQYKKIEEFDERYFQIDPWYWFSGFQIS